jgi:hypothetical protein
MFAVRFATAKSLTPWPNCAQAAWKLEFWELIERPKCRLDFVFARLCVFERFRQKVGEADE